MSRKSQRDESLERLLGESLRTSSRPPQAGSCPDAETLAAWAEGALAGAQLAAAQEHVADCVACQSILAVLARTTPSEVSSEPWWRRGVNARWLVPVAATATAIAIWVAVPRDEFTSPPEQAPTVASEVAAAQPEATTEPQAATDAPGPVAQTGPAGPRITESLPIEQPAAELRFEVAQEAAPADAAAQRAAPAESIEGRQGDVSASGGRSDAAAPQPAAPAAAPAERARLGTLSRAARLASPRVEISSPNTAFRWRFGAGGAAEYSADAGSTWEARPTGVDVDLLAGASPSGTVCWVAGRTGTVLLTVDGRQWRRLAFPVAVDLSAVQATDASTATVTSVDGRRFRTVDGGATWESL